MADVVSWVSKPCRCLFHITPAIPNRHFIPSSLLFFIHNSQLALNGGGLKKVRKCPWCL